MSRSCLNDRMTMSKETKKKERGGRGKRKMKEKEKKKVTKAISSHMFCSCTALCLVTQPESNSLQSHGL